MYSNKENVNILTALLVAHGVRHAVVCPGSRNAPIVHNLNECPDIECWPVTDERSAAFCAMGMAQQLGQPVVVCVTSGSALLGCAPAVAEAYYRQLPLVVVSADRPPQWIDQQDGQTLPQPDALGRFVRCAVSLPEVFLWNEEDGMRHEECRERRWFCNRMVNEALLATRLGPVHINVPLSEPLFQFTADVLPTERKIELLAAETPPHTLSHVARMFMLSKRPMLISGQPFNTLMDEAVMLVGNNPDYVPDLVLCTGSSIVSKRLKHFLRKARETWVVSRTGTVADTFQNLTRVIEGDGEVVADLVRAMLHQQPHPFVRRWEALIADISQRTDAFEPPYSQLLAVKSLYRHLTANSRQVPAVNLHLANSSAIRLANICNGLLTVFDTQHTDRQSNADLGQRTPDTRLSCNRGVNGIEGSLSTAVGMSLVTDEMVCCVIGDLSFFYDRNALWNQRLRSNLRILLLNNQGGGIFHQLPGLEQSPARDALVAAHHRTHAEDTCRLHGVEFRNITEAEQTADGISWLLAAESPAPRLLQVVTTARQDGEAIKAYHDMLLAAYKN